MVTSIGNGSISDAHTGVIPFRIAASGKPPMPSNRLPIVSSGITFLRAAVLHSTAAVPPETPP